MPLRQWIKSKDRPEQVRLLSKEYGISPFLARILVGRGLDSPAKAGEFLEVPSLSDPFLLPDMQRAVDRIRLAVQRKERIAVYGDYDCDGVCSTVMLVRYLRSLGTDTVYYVPEREEGYGLNLKAIHYLKEQKVSLIVTVDNGISAQKEIGEALRLGLDVVVTDHHQVGDVLPPAIAVVDAQRKDCSSPFRAFCGAGVTLQLIRALSADMAEQEEQRYISIAAIATVGDVVDLVSENRFIVRKGLDGLASCPFPGLLALLEVSGLAGKQITSEAIAYGVVPRINAAGRMGKASLAVELLMTEDKQQAYSLACTIHDFNVQRQKQEQEIMAQIDEQLSKCPDQLHQRVLVLSGKGWNHGVIGIASAKLLERFGKPNVLFSIEDGIAVGSARSFGDFSLYEALCSCSSLFRRFGGHKQAAGLEIAAERLPAFAQAINEYAQHHFPEMPALEYRIDSVLHPDELTIANVQSLSCLEPFGAANPSPLFLLPHVRIVEIIPLSSNRHIKLKLRSMDYSFEALQFGVGTDRFPYAVGQEIDLLVALEVNEFRGKRSVSVKIRDIHPSWVNVEHYWQEKNAYEAFRRGESLPDDLREKFLPTREDVAVVYRYLRSHGGFCGDLDMLYIKPMITALGYGKYRVILDVLQELGLIVWTISEERIDLVPVKTKVSLECSALMRKLNSI